ncbi:MAG TPA: HXXEE domain-containing protein [Chitinophagaceae bacterium]|nr:HXXEE domain-containing protein [Chitinophagaceae bacterium]
MDKPIRITFLLIALVQGLHSIEEYIGKLWEVYPPATYICGLVSQDLEYGFIIINISLFVVLMSIWLATFSKNFSVKPLLWLWTILELINGAGHCIWAIIERSYVPGLATAPVLFILALIMVKLLTRPVNRTSG